jgi:hypothetical protein
VWAEAEGKRQDGIRIRDALLGELGYEVNLQGEPWDGGSCITIQKPSEPNYDIQLSSAPGGANRRCAPKITPGGAPASTIAMSRSSNAGATIFPA